MSSNVPLTAGQPWPYVSLDAGSVVTVVIGRSSPISSIRGGSEGQATPSVRRPDLLLVRSDNDWHGSSTVCVWAYWTACVTQKRVGSHKEKGLTLFANAQISCCLIYCHLAKMWRYTVLWRNMHISNRIIYITIRSNYFNLCSDNHIHTKQRQWQYWTKCQHPELARPWSTFLGELHLCGHQVEPQELRFQIKMSHQPRVQHPSRLPFQKLFSAHWVAFSLL